MSEHGFRNKDRKDGDRLRFQEIVGRSDMIRDVYLTGEKEDVFVIVPAYPMHALGTSVTNGGECRGIRYLFNRTIDRSVTCEADLPGGSWASFMEKTAADILSGEDERSAGIREVCGLSTAALMKNTGAARVVFRIPETGKEENDAKGENNEKGGNNEKRGNNENGGNSEKGGNNEKEGNNDRPENMTEVIVFATGGADSNACRAGDPSSYYEWNGSFFVKGPAPGTINIFVLIDAVLPPGALARALITATEAKTTVLQDSAVPSRYSSGQATGTGTDGIIIASADEGSGRPYLTDMTHHARAGEMISAAVRAAVSEALFRETGLCAGRQKTILRRLERFGIRPEDLKDIPEAVQEDGAAVGLVSMICRLKDETDAGLITQDEAKRTLRMCFPEKDGAGAPAETDPDDPARMISFDDDFGKSLSSFLRKRFGAGSERP